jgi:hypothetical protein
MNKKQENERKTEKNTFASVGGFKVIVYPMTESINLPKVVRERKFRILPGEVGNDFVDGRRNFLKKRVIDKFDEAVKRQLKIN